MPDIYATILQADVGTQERLAGVLEIRAADAQQQAILRSYLSEIQFPPAARALEIGCGTAADALASSGRIGSELCGALKAEARRRADADGFFGFIAFATFIARKPG